MAQFDKGTDRIRIDHAQIHKVNDWLRKKFFTNY